MEPRKAPRTSPSASLHHNSVLNPRGAKRVVAGVWIGLVLCGPLPEASALPAPDELLQELQISDRDRQRIREGDIVTWTATEGSDRELALGMAMLVKKKTENV